MERQRRKPTLTVAPGMKAPTEEEMRAHMFEWEAKMGHRSRAIVERFWGGGGPQIVYDRRNSSSTNDVPSECIELSKLAVDLFNKQNPRMPPFSLAKVELIKATRDGAMNGAAYDLTFSTYPEQPEQVVAQTFEARVWKCYSLAPGLNAEVRRVALVGHHPSTSSHDYYSDHAAIQPLLCAVGPQIVYDRHYPHLVPVIIPGVVAQCIELAQLAVESFNIDYQQMPFSMSAVELIKATCDRAVDGASYILTFSTYPEHVVADYFRTMIPPPCTLSRTFEARVWKSYGLAPGLDAQVRSVKLVGHDFIPSTSSHDDR